MLNIEHKHIIVDYTKMQEILSNLISNAIKYTPEGGKVLIDVQELPYNQEGYALIQTKVSDTGIGMSELGKGSTLTITIPHKISYKDYTNRNIESSNEFDIDFKGKRILLAEENELNAEITTTILSEMGFVVKAVENGILCVNEMQHQPANT